MKFEEKLTLLRKQFGLSQEDVADKIGVSRQAISRWESGATLPDAVNLIQLSNLFHVSIDSMLRDEVALDENIVFREKGDVVDIGQKNYRHNLVSAIMWAFGAVFFLFGGLLEKKLVYVAVGFLYLTFSCSYFYNVLKERDE